MCACICVLLIVPGSSKGRSCSYMTNTCSCLMRWMRRSNVFILHVTTGLLVNLPGVISWWMIHCSKVVSQGMPSHGSVALLNILWDISITWSRTVLLNLFISKTPFFGLKIPPLTYVNWTASHFKRQLIIVLASLQRNKAVVLAEPPSRESLSLSIPAYLHVPPSSPYISCGTLVESLV